MKSILIVDTPKSCEECRLTYIHTRKDTFCCCLTDKEVECRNDKENRDASCPLRQLPKWKIDGCSAFNENGGIVYDDEVFDWLKELIE